MVLAGGDGYAALRPAVHLMAEPDVDKLNLENFANLATWVAVLNRDLEDIFADRLQDALTHWTKAFSAAEVTLAGRGQAVHAEGALYRAQFPSILVESRRVYDVFHGFQWSSFPKGDLGTGTLRT